MVKAVYIHIPFCKNICSYCGFCKFYYDEERASLYLDQLKKEIVENYQGEKISTLYIGGGTPSDLSTSNLKKLLELTTIFKKYEEYEFTFECNFSINREKLLLLKEYGVNRLSFGIETTHPKYLKILERKDTVSDIISKIHICREIGFSNINGDLMYAFFPETQEEVKKDLEFLISLNLEHISTYSLIVEEHTKLYLQQFKNCSDEEDFKMYSLIHNVLEEKGYHHYEVSNFCKDGYESKHNMTYWENLEYYGFGIGASGYLGGIRYSNTRSFQQYISENYRYEIEKLDSYDTMSYEMILGLRMKKGVSFEEFYQKYGKEIEEVFFYQDYLEKDYLKIEDGKLFIPYDKWYVMNSILERFVR